MKKLSALPFEYKGDLEFIKKILVDIIEKYPTYSNFIDNYFKSNKLEFFKDLSLDYSRISKVCRTNNYLEIITAISKIN